MPHGHIPRDGEAEPGPAIVAAAGVVERPRPLRNAEVSASQAAEKAASRGAVTSVNVDDDRASVWEVEVVRDHKAHDLDVNPHTGKVTQAPSEDGKAEDHDED